MKKYLILIISVCCLIANSIYAVQTNNNQSERNLDFERRINTIHSKVVDLTDIFVLHNVKEFNEVYLAPTKFEATALSYIQSKVSFENKIIAVCSMTQLPMNKYIGILNSYFELFKKNKIDEQLLYRCFFNEFDVNYRLAKAYKNPSVRLLLTKMLNDKVLSKEFKKDVKATLNGKWYRDLERFKQS